MLAYTDTIPACRRWQTTHSQEIPTVYVRLLRVWHIRITNMKNKKNENNFAWIRLYDSNKEYCCHGNELDGNEQQRHICLYVSEKEKKRKHVAAASSLTLCHFVIVCNLARCTWKCTVVGALCLTSEHIIEGETFRLQVRRSWTQTWPVDMCSDTISSRSSKKSKTRSILRSPKQNCRYIFTCEVLGCVIFNSMFFFKSEKRHLKL